MVRIHLSWPVQVQGKGDWEDPNFKSLSSMELLSKEYDFRMDIYKIIDLHICSKFHLFYELTILSKRSILDLFQLTVKFSSYHFKIGLESSHVFSCYVMREKDTSFYNNSIHYYFYWSINFVFIFFSLIT